MNKEHRTSKTIILKNRERFYSVVEADLPIKAAIPDEQHMSGVAPARLSSGTGALSLSNVHEVDASDRQ